MCGRIDQGLTNWPELASVARLPSRGWTPRMLHDRKDARGDRVIIRLDHPDHSPVVLKQSFRAEDRNQIAGSAAVQGRAAQSLAGHPEARMPRILAVLPDRLCMLMDVIEGHELASFIGTQDETLAIGAAGRWLDVFHAAGPVASMAFQPRNLIEPLERVAAEVRAGRRQIARPARFLAHLLSLIAQVPSTRNCQTLRTALHGDLTGRNLILADRVMWGIDPAPFRLGPAVQDIARLLVFMALKPSAGNPDGPGGIVPRSIADPFLAAYSHVKGTCPVLQLALRSRLLSEWVAVPTGLSELQPAARRRFNRICDLAEAALS